MSTTVAQMTKSELREMIVPVLAVTSGAMGALSSGILYYLWDGQALMHE